MSRLTGRNPIRDPVRQGPFAPFQRRAEKYFVSSVTLRRKRLYVAAMRMRLDSDADALYVRFSERSIETTSEVRPGVMLDYDAEGHIVGVEILNASQSLGVTDLKQLAVEVA